MLILSVSTLSQHSTQSGIAIEFDREEAALIRQYSSKGIKLNLCEQTSVVNKKIDIFLASDSAFCRSKFFKKMTGAMDQKLLNHVINVDHIRSNGEGTKRSTSNIFGKPLALHLTVTESCGVSLQEKLVIRFCESTFLFVARESDTLCVIVLLWLSAEVVCYLCGRQNLTVALHPFLLCILSYAPQNLDKEHLDCDKNAPLSSKVGYLVQVNAGRHSYLANIYMLVKGKLRGASERENE